MKKLLLFLILLSSRCYALNFDNLYFTINNDPHIHKELKECLNVLLFAREQDLSDEERHEINKLTKNIGSELIAIGGIVTESHTDYEDYKKNLIAIAANDLEFAQTQDILDDIGSNSIIKEMALQQLRMRYREFALLRQKQMESFEKAKRTEIINTLVNPLQRRKNLVETLVHECDEHSEIHTPEQCATAREFLAQIDRSLEEARSRADILLNNFKI